MSTVGFSRCIPLLSAASTTSFTFMPTVPASSTMRVTVALTFLGGSRFVVSSGAQSAIARSNPRTSF